MASTNKTTHYDLPQWIGTDKPTFLGDFNAAFNTIDATMYTADSNATNAVSTANQANSTAGEANTAVQSLTETVNDNTSKIVTVTNLANSTVNKVNNLISLTPPISLLTTGNYLSNYNPIEQINTVVYRTLELNGITLLNIYGQFNVSYTGTPSIQDIGAFSQLSISKSLNTLIRQYVTSGSRTIYNLANFVYSNTTDNTRNITVGLLSNPTTIEFIRQESPEQPAANSSINFYFQNLIILGNKI